MTIYRSSVSIFEPMRTENAGQDIGRTPPDPGPGPENTGQSVPDPASKADADAARALLVAHVPDQETGLCLVCFVPSPCRPANAAANRLVELDQPLPPPEQTRPRRNGWRDWLWRPYHWRIPRPAPLLSHVWQLRFGLIGNRLAGTRAAGNRRPGTYPQAREHLWTSTNQRPYRASGKRTGAGQRAYRADHRNSATGQRPGRHRQPAWAA